MRRFAIFSALVLALAGGGWFGLGALERKAIYPFDARRIAPARVGLPEVTEHVFHASGHDIIIWVAPPAPGKPTIFYLHGNAGNLASRAGRFQRLVDRGYGLIAPAYRGSSGSTGRPSEQAITSDMRRIYKSLDTFVPGLEADQTVVYGESLGTGVALKILAAGATPVPRGVVLEAPYTSLPDVVRHIYPQMETLLPKMTSIWNSVEHIRSLRAPLLVMHGTQDLLIPMTQGRTVFDAARSVQKNWHAVRGAGHSDIWRSDTLPVMWRFIEGE